MDFTDEGLKYLPNLTTLDCGENKYFTDQGLKYLPNLTTLFRV
jgi:Leucine-rich repeat (LRR) protein